MPRIQLDQHLPLHHGRNRVSSATGLSKSLLGLKKNRIISIAVIALVFVSVIGYSNSNSSGLREVHPSSSHGNNALSGVAPVAPPRRPTKPKAGGAGFLGALGISGKKKPKKGDAAGEFDPHGTNEDEPFDQSLEESFIERPAELTATEKENAKSLEASVNKRQLQALIYYIAEGGEVDDDLDLEYELSVVSEADVSSDGAQGGQLVLGSGHKIKDDWASWVQKRYPLVVFSKSYCPYSRKAKSIINFLQPTPGPLIIEVDLRSDSSVLKRILTKLTGRATFPNVLLALEPLGGGDDVELLYNEGGLSTKFKEAGMKVVL